MLKRWNRFFLWVALKYTKEIKNKNEIISMRATNPIIGTNLNSSKTELVQPWGLGHSGPLVPHVTIAILFAPS
jgi:hypothetical protein